MIDQVEQLEQHVTTLLRLFESAKIKIEELKQENGALRQQGKQLGDKVQQTQRELEAAQKENDELQRRVEHLSEVETQNEQMHNQILQFEGDIETMAAKETQIRERLRTILSKIDTIENELTSTGGAN